jgi:hypothetical protein
MIINVTQDHINQGSRKMAKACPVALALCQAGLENPVVGTTGATYEHPDDGSRVISDLPAWVGYRVRRFDEGEGMEPFSFELEV